MFEILTQETTITETVVVQVDGMTITHTVTKTIVEPVIVIVL